MAILAQGTYSENRLTAELRYGAQAVAPDPPACLGWSERAFLGRRAARRQTGLLVHGTWARTESWWQPGGDFPRILPTTVRPDLYSDPDRFEWSGGYSDAARSVGGSDLADWLVEKSTKGADLFAHSHGGTWLCSRPTMLEE